MAGALRQCNYKYYKADINILYSRLKETIKSRQTSPYFVQEVENFIQKIQALDVNKVEEEGEGGEKDDLITQNINNVDDQDDTEINTVD